MQILPIKLTKIGRTAIYGSFFNFYLCQFQGNVILPNGQPLPSPTTSPADKERGATSDEQPPFRERNPVKIGAISHRRADRL